MVSKRKNKNRSKLRKINTDKLEENLRELLIDLVDERGLISRYTLEGHLLYTIGCDNLHMDNAIMNLINNEELELVELDDGFYYQFYPI